MNNKNQPQEEKSAREKALEIIPIIVGGIFLLLGMYFTNVTLKIVFCTLAGVVAIGAYIVVLIREIINRRKKKRGK